MKKIMKRILWVLITLFVSVITLSSCSSDDDSTIPNSEELTKSLYGKWIPICGYTIEYNEDGTTERFGVDEDDGKWNGDYVGWEINTKTFSILRYSKNEGWYKVSEDYPIEWDGTKMKWTEPSFGFDNTAFEVLEIVNSTEIKLLIKRYWNKSHEEQYLTYKKI